MASGLLAGLAALLHSALVNQGSHIDGGGYELTAIAAVVVIGGTSLAGGVGTVFGSMVGALTLSVLDNILGLRNISRSTRRFSRASSSSSPSCSTSSPAIHLNQGIRRTPRREPLKERDC